MKPEYADAQKLTIYMNIPVLDTNCQESWLLVTELDIAYK